MRQLEHSHPDKSTGDSLTKFLRSSSMFSNNMGACDITMGRSFVLAVTVFAFS